MCPQMPSKLQAGCDLSAGVCPSCTGGNTLKTALSKCPQALTLLAAHCCRPCTAAHSLRACSKDWGFLICGSDLADAMGCFDDRLKETLVLSAEAGDTVAEDTGTPPQRLSANGSTVISADGSKPLTAVLGGAFKRLQEKVGPLRTHSEPGPELLAAAAAAGVKSPTGSKPQFVGTSEPSSPMIGSEALPDSIRNISTIARRQSSEYSRVPTVQAGMRPW